MKDKKTGRDIFLTAVLLFISLLTLFVLLCTSETGEWAVVAVNGVETGRFSLLQDGVFELNGGSNILEIRDKTARLSEANCPDGLCVKQGTIRFEGQCITCLPNRLTVTIESFGSPVDIVL